MTMEVFLNSLPTDPNPRIGCLLSMTKLDGADPTIDRHTSLAQLQAQAFENDVRILLAMTSNDWAVKTLKRAWKPLQRWVYVAAVLTLAHWIFLEYELGAALAHFLPLAGLELYRIIRNSRSSAALVDA